MTNKLYVWSSESMMNNHIMSTHELAMAFDGCELMYLGINSDRICVKSVMSIVPKGSVILYPMGMSDTHDDFYNHIKSQFSLCPMYRTPYNHNLFLVTIELPDGDRKYCYTK